MKNINPLSLTSLAVGDNHMLGLLPKIGICMLVHRSNEGFSISYQGIDIAKLTYKLGQPLTRLALEPVPDLAYPETPLTPQEASIFYPILDSLGLSFEYSLLTGLECRVFNSTLFSGIQSLGVQVYAKTLGVHLTTSHHHVATLIRVGSNLGIVVVWEPLLGKMHVFLLDIIKHSPSEIAMIVSMCTEATEKLHAIAVTHKYKHFNKDHPKYLDDWE